MYLNTVYLNKLSFKLKYSYYIDIDKPYLGCGNG